MRRATPVRIALALALCVVTGCGGETAEVDPPARPKAQPAPAVGAVPVPDGSRIVFDATECPSSPERCVRSAVLRGRPGQSPGQLRKAHEARLERARWTRTPACASLLPQYTDPRGAVEVFLTPSQRVIDGQSSTPTLGEELVGAIRESARAGRPTVVLEIAKAADAPPC